MPAATSAANAPGLCSACAAEEGAWEGSYLRLRGEASAQEERQRAAHAACRQCHSGTLSQEVLCGSAECPVHFVRLQARDAAALASALALRAARGCPGGHRPLV